MKKTKLKIFKEKFLNFKPIKFIILKSREEYEKQKDYINFYFSYNGNNQHSNRYGRKYRRN